jgi:hypothetical protein
VSPQELVEENKDKKSRAIRHELFIKKWNFIAIK